MPIQTSQSEGHAGFLQSRAASAGPSAGHASYLSARAVVQPLPKARVKTISWPPLDIAHPASRAGRVGQGMARPMAMTMTRRRQCRRKVRCGPAAELIDGGQGRSAWRVGR